MEISRDNHSFIEIGVDVNVNKNQEETKIDKLEFNTYCIFTEEKQEVKETIGLIFKDYIEKLKLKAK